MNEPLIVAQRFHQQGHLEQAEKHYRKALEVDPSNARALFLLGSLFAQREQYPEAKRFLQDCIRLDTNNPVAYANLGNALSHLGELDEAISCYERALISQPSYTEALCSLGYLFAVTGKTEKAFSYYHKALRVEPTHTETLANLGALLLECGKSNEAIECLEKARATGQLSAAAYYNLGLAYHRTSHPEKALAAYEKAIERNPLFSNAYKTRGTILYSQGRFGDAINEFQKALRIEPNCIETLNNLGEALHAFGEPDKALDVFTQAIGLDPMDWRAWANRSGVESALGNYVDAVASLNTAANRAPNEPVVHYRLGIVYTLQGLIDKALESFRIAIELDPTFMEAHSTYLLTTNYVGALHGVEQRREHERWYKSHAMGLTRYSDHANTRDPDRALRVGYVSPDLRRHSVAFFIEPILANHDRKKVQTYCYANVRRPDTVTTRLKQLADHWIDAVGITDECLAERVRNDQIDILVDLAGHTAHHRLLVFARKPAPIQITYLGYPNTTGVATIDYRLTGELADPIGCENFYTETLVRLPNGFLCYLPPSSAPPPSPLPANANGFVTYGSFNNLAKITPDVIACWSEILRCDPSSRLLLKNKSFRDQSIRGRVRGLFREHGIASERIDMTGWTDSFGEHLELYNRIDIALDTFPYNGTTTTCEAFWMGVPVITLVGKYHAGRVGLSLLSQVGLGDWAAYSGSSYVEKAVEYATARDELDGCRAGLRNRMLASSLCDGAAFTRELEKHYRRLWQSWCAKGGPDTFSAPK